VVDLLNGLVAIMVSGVDKSAQFNQAIEEVNHILVLAKFARLKMCTHASISKEE